MIGGSPTLWNVQLQPSKPGGQPAVTTDGGDLHITSATGVVYIDGTLIVNLSSATTFGSSSATGTTNVFSAGITVNGAVGTFNAGLTVNGLGTFNNGISVSASSNFGSLVSVFSLSSSTTLTANTNIIATTGYVQAATKVYAGIGGYTYDCLISGGNTNAFIAADGSGNAGLDVRSLGFGAVRLQSHSGTATQFNVAAVASTANYYTAYGAVSGGSPIMYSDGSDTNIYMLLSSKGTSSVNIYTGQGSRSQFYVADSTGTNQAYAQGGTTPTFGSNGGDLKLAPNSTYIQIGQTFSAAAVPATFSATSIWTIKDAAGNTKYVPVASATW
jgi:hypothetical protein